MKYTLEVQLRSRSTGGGHSLHSLSQTRSPTEENKQDEKIDQNNMKLTFIIKTSISASITTRKEFLKQNALT